MMEDENRAFYLVEYWYDYFPAITGADVDLIHRREMMSILQKCSEDSSLKVKSRQAATLWMGLVFLTDPKEFAHSRVTIRDAMLAYPEPDQAQCHDCWMRVLDTLLAHDTPSSWPELTKPLTAHPVTLRRAVRERVRGVMSHFDAIVREFDSSVSSSDWSGAFALWQDTGRWLAAHPGSAEETRVKEWRRDTMFHWLKTDGLGTKWNPPYYSGFHLTNLSPEDVIELSPEQEAELYAKAREWSQIAVKEAMKAMDEPRLFDKYDRIQHDDAHTAIEHVRVLHPFLTRAHQDDISRKITPALIRPLVYSSETKITTKRGESRFTICNRCTKFLGKSWHVMPPQDLKTLCENSRRMLTTSLFGSYILYIDAWSTSPAFSNEEWLLYAFAINGRWKVVPRDTPREIVGIVPYKSLPIPPVSDESVRKVIEKLKPVFFDGKGQMIEFQAALSNLTALYGDEFLFSDFEGMYRRCRRGSGELDSSQGRSFENWAKSIYFFMGLIKADEALQLVLTQQAQEDWGEAIALLRLSPDLLNPWSGVLKSPEIASQILEQLIGCSDDRLRSLLSAAITSPPSDEVVRAMWNTFRGSLTTTEKIRDKLTIYGALMHIAPLLPQDERLAMRQDFLSFFKATPVPVNGWPDEVMFDIRQPSVHWIMGSAIPWEDDSLAAALSWSSEIGVETDPCPSYGQAEKMSGVFSYLTHALVSYVHNGLGGFSSIDYPSTQPIPITEWKRKPLYAPFEPTPWQRARDLLLRRPDLRFPDPAWSRPGRRNH